MRIAICDDEQASRELLEKYITEWAYTTKQKMYIKSFINSEEFLFCWEEDKSYDLLILDIEMGNLSGMDLAKLIRQQNKEIGILFVTGFEQYMSMGYEVEALHYLLKPLKKEKLYDILLRMKSRTKKEERYIFNTKEGMISVILSDVYYIEAQGHECAIFTKNKKYIIQQGINNIKNQLINYKDFQLSHRSYLVNMKNVSAIGKNEIVLDDDRRLPVSRSMIKEVSKAFIECNI